MSRTGIHRVTYANLQPNTVVDVNLFVNGEPDSQKTIIVKPICEGGKFIKYLNRNGEYRCWYFNSYYEEKIEANNLGSTNELILSILTAQGSEKDLGSKVKRQLDLVAENVSANELLILSDLYTSPRVYLYIGDKTDYSPQNWLLVKVKNTDNIIKRRKANFSDIDLTIELPENSTISSI